MRIIILSSSKDIMTDREARLEKIIYIIVNGVEKKRIYTITLDTLVNV